MGDERGVTTAEAHRHIAEDFLRAPGRERYAMNATIKRRWAKETYSPRHPSYVITSRSSAHVSRKRPDGATRAQDPAPPVLGARDSLAACAVNFEWTVCRAVLFLSNTPNTKLRALMRDYFSLERYKELWKSELVVGRSCEPLAVIVRNWSAVRKAFEARNRLVHGRDRFTRKMATPHVEALLRATSYVDSYCESLGSPLFGRMPVRRKPR